MPKKTDIKKEVELDVNTLSEAERKDVGVHNNYDAIRWQTKGVYFGLVLLLVLALAGGLFWWLSTQYKGKVAFTIDGKKYYARDVEKIQEQAAKEGVSEQESLDTIIDVEKQKLAAAKLGVVPNQDMISVALQQKGYNENTSEWHKLKSYNEAQQAAVLQAQQGYYDIAFFTFDYSRMLDATGGAVGEKLAEGYRQPDAVARERDYAKAKAEEYREKYINKKITATELADIIHKDLRLAAHGVNNKSGVYRLNEDGDVLLTTGSTIGVNKDWLAFLKDFNNPGVTEIKTGKITQYDLPNKPQVDGYYIFIDYRGKIEPQADIEQRFNQALGALKVEKNVK